MMPFGFDKARPEGLRLLLLGAHSDDIEIGCGATLLKMIDAGQVAAVRWVVFAAAGERQQEAQASADTYLAGVAEKEISILDYQDTRLPYAAPEIKAYFNEHIRSFAPDLVFTHYRDDRHQDHRIISDLSWNTFRNHCVLEYEIPKYDGDLGIPNCYSRVADQFAKQKVDYLMKHFASQTNKHWFDPETFLGLMRIRGLEAASPTRYAEAFHARKLVF
ncbi:MAG: PIG-L deacetylase family protein [Bacteroidota bacterium]